MPTLPSLELVMYTDLHGPHLSIDKRRVSLRFGYIDAVEGAIDAPGRTTSQRSRRRRRCQRRRPCFGSRRQAYRQSWTSEPVGYCASCARLRECARVELGLARQLLDHRDRKEKKEKGEEVPQEYAAVCVVALSRTQRWTIFLRPTRPSVLEPPPLGSGTTQSPHVAERRQDEGERRQSYDRSLAHMT